MSSETYAFSANINQLLSLIINTIYSNKEIFLRELISNASDALNKLRYNSLTDTECLNSDPNLEIKISFDRENKILRIQDSGIGMTKEELINNLGTIASSGTKAFLESITNNTNDVSLIGQFGVGFYSAFLVSDKVIVYSKNNNDDIYSWESSADGSFIVQKEDEQSSNIELKRGTQINLYLKEDQLQYLEENNIINLIKKHNQFIEFPIYVELEKSRQVEENNGLGPIKVEYINPNQVEDVEDVEEDTKPNLVTENYYEYELVNKGKPIWTRNTKDISENEYADFYKLISGDFDSHLDLTHFSVEGQVEFKGLLYVPKRVPSDMGDLQKKASKIKLYVRKVFITDECDILPDYLKFVNGVVESNDIPLNISRETLQQNLIVKLIGKSVVKKIMDMITNISEDSEKFKIFYEQFSKNLKLGVHEDNNNRVKLTSFLRYETSKSQGDLISIDEYISNMQENQNNIYYITGESVKAINNSPFLERLREKNYEVIYMTDPLDEYVVQQVRDYKDKKLVCITKENLDLNDSNDEKQVFENAVTEFKNVCEYFKLILGDNVEKVIISNKLANSPCILSTSEFGWTSNMQRIVKAQTFGRNEMQHMLNKKILEINPNSKLIIKIKEKLDNDDKDKHLVNLVQLLYDITLQSSGFTLDDPSRFSKRVIELINLGLGIDDDFNENVEEESINENYGVNSMEDTD